MTRIVLVAVATLLLLPDEGISQSVRDSAGIRIVTHPANARPKAVWRLEPRPMLQIGGSSGTGPTEFSDIWDAARTPDGGVAVSDGGPEEVRVFDASGRFVNRIGRRGPGPGEFAQIKSLAVYGDTIHVVDTRRGTAVFLLDGTLVRHPALPSTAPYHPVEVGGVFADGSVIVTGGGGTTREEMQRVGTRIEMRGLLRIAGDGRSSQLFGVVPTYQSYRAADGPLGGELVMFSPFFSAAAFRDHVCHGRPQTYEIRCLDANGALKQIIRRDRPIQPVTRAARDAVIETRKKPAPATHGHASPSAIELEQMALKTPFAESFPAYDWMIAGHDGELWVSDFLLSQHTKPYWEPTPANVLRRFNIFARDGAWIGAIDVPARLLVKEAGRDYVLGVSRDDDNVEGVAMYRIIR